MKPESQRIAIAEACGWTKCDTSGSECWISPSGIHSTSGNVVFPSYLTSLDAMHDAEKALTDDQSLLYFDTLVEMIAGSVENPRHSDFKRIVSATAPKRAEAFLRTIGKWEDS